MAEAEDEKRAPVLDPIERVSEIIFGLIMALTFTGSLSAASAGTGGNPHGDVCRARLQPRLGTGRCGHVPRRLADRADTQSHAVAPRARRRGPQEAHAIIADALPGRLGEVIGAEGLEGMRRRLAALPEPPARARLGRDDFFGAFGVFLLVVLATFPVVVPFMLFSETALAMRVSNAVALVTLFAGRLCARALFRGRPLADRVRDGRDRCGSGGRHHGARG